MFVLKFVCIKPFEQIYCDNAKKSFLRNKYRDILLIWKHKI